MATGDTGKQVDPRELRRAIRTTSIVDKTVKDWANEVLEKAEKKGGNR